MNDVTEGFDTSLWLVATPKLVGSLVSVGRAGMQPDHQQHFKKKMLMELIQLHIIIINIIISSSSISSI